MHCSEALLTRSIDVEAVTAEVSKLAVVRQVVEGQQLFTFGEVPDSFFLILKVGWGWEGGVGWGKECHNLQGLEPPREGFKGLLGPS